MKSNKPATRQWDVNGLASGSLMIKPVGSACNLDCDYCYYLRVADDVYGGHTRRISEQTLEATLGDYLAAAPDTATICWQGGEPTLAGLAFFKKAVQIQKACQRPGQQVSHALQTNGTLLNDEWGAFFKREAFLVGISVDGRPALHDRFRRDADSRKTHARVMRGLKTLRRHGVEHNILCVLHRENVKHPRHLLEYLVRLGAKWLQFIPAVEWETDAPTGEPRLAPYSPRPDDYGRFLCDTFDLWFEKYRDKISIRDFDAALQRMVSTDTSLCIYSESCHSQLTVESNGDVYGCDHFVEPRWRIGHVSDHRGGSHTTSSAVQLTVAAEACAIPDNPKTNWLERIDGNQLGVFADRKLRLPDGCLKCDWLNLCHGGCPKDRPHRGDLPEASILCEGYKMFFSHATMRLQWLAAHLMRGVRPPFD